MTTYELIRVALGLALLWLAAQQIPKSLRVYAGFMAAFQLLPQLLDSADWWRQVWSPLSVVQMILGASVCCEIFSIQTQDRTFWYERVTVRSSGACLGVAFALMAWRWHPENLFQSWVTIVQYYRLILFVGWVAVSIWFGWVRPLVPRDSDATAKFWTVWLGCQFVMSTTGRSGLIWEILPSSVVIYRIVNDCGMAIQILAVLYLCLKGTYARRRKHSTDYTSTSSTATA